MAFHSLKGGSLRVVLFEGHDLGFLWSERSGPEACENGEQGVLSLRPWEGGHGRSRLSKAVPWVLEGVWKGLYCLVTNAGSGGEACLGPGRVCMGPSGTVPRKDSYLVDPASSHMLVSKIKPCMSKYKQVCTVKLRMAH